jgi:hypothetical protein
VVCLPIGGLLRSWWTQKQTEQASEQRVELEKAIYQVKKRLMERLGCLPAGLRIVVRLFQDVMDRCTNDDGE